MYTGLLVVSTPLWPISIRLLSSGRKYVLMYSVPSPTGQESARLRARLPFNGSAFAQTRDTWGVDAASNPLYSPEGERSYPTGELTLLIELRYAG